jgi:hypothetical protein
MTKTVTAIICLLLKLSAFSQPESYQFIGGITVITLITKDSVWIAADSKQLQ